MAFIRTKRVHKNGKTYVYQYVQASVRVPGKKNPKSVHLGRPNSEWPAAAMLLNPETMARNCEAIEAGRNPTEANPGAEEKGPDVGPTTPVS